MLSLLKRFKKPNSDERSDISEKVRKDYTPFYIAAFTSTNMADFITRSILKKDFIEKDLINPVALNFALRAFAHKLMIRELAKSRHYFDPHIKFVVSSYVNKYITDISEYNEYKAYKDIRDLVEEIFNEADNLASPDILEIYCFLQILERCRKDRKIFEEDYEQLSEKYGSLVELASEFITGLPIILMKGSDGHLEKALSVLKKDIDTARYPFEKYEALLHSLVSVGDFNSIINTHMEELEKRVTAYK